MLKNLRKNPFQSFTPLGLAGLAGLLVIAAVIVWFIFIRPGQQHEAAVKANAASEFSTGRTQSGQDATKSILDNINQEKTDDSITAKGNEGIRAAAGPDDQVSRRSNCARIRAQCMQRDRSSDGTCRALLESCSAIGY